MESTAISPAARKTHQPCRIHSWHGVGNFGCFRLLGIEVVTRTKGGQKGDKRGTVLAPLIRKDLNPNLGQNHGTGRSKNTAKSGALKTDSITARPTAVRRQAGSIVSNGG
jgi:hypothetical protein